MSDNGPHMQPPQYPYGGESGGQPAGPYGGGPHGPPGAGHGPPGGGQYPLGPYGTGPQYPPPEQGMHQGGAPPYGPPGPGMHPGPGDYPPPKKSNLGLWIVLGGGVVIVILIGLVITMLVRGSSGGEQVAAPDGEETEEAATEEEDADEQTDDGGETDEEDTADAPDTEVGEPPHALPEDACAGLTDDSLADLDASESRTQSDDNRASCTFDTHGEVDIDGEMTLTYSVPFVDSNSADEAASDFDYQLDAAMDESSDIIGYTVLEDEELDLGDQAHIVFREVDNVWMSNEAIVLIQQDNMLVEVDWVLDPDDILDDDAPAPADYADVEDYLPDLGAEALDNMG